MSTCNHSRVLAAQNSSDPLWDPTWLEADGERTIQARAEECKLKLYASWFCPFAQRVWIALEEKGLPYEYIEVNGYAVDPEMPGGYSGKSLPLKAKRALNPAFVDASPRGLVPAINHDSKLLWDSIPLVEYISELPGGLNDFTPPSAYERALTRIWTVNIIADKIIKQFYVMLSSQDEETQAQAKLAVFVGCRELASHMSSEGDFILGNQFTWIDIYLAPFWQRFLSVGKFYRNFEFPSADSASDNNDDAGGEFARLNRWWQAVSSRPSVAQTLVCEARLISWYTHYAQAKGSGAFIDALKKK